jgi:hypothetical protein
MRQKNLSRCAWRRHVDPDNLGRVSVYIVNSEQFRHDRLPASVQPDQRGDLHGMGAPWFDLYDEDLGDVPRPIV